MGNDKIRPDHRERRAYVYARQSSQAQLLHNRTSTERQFDLRGRAIELGWSSERVEVIADDLGRSGKFSENRNGFQRLAAECGLGRVGIVLSLDVSRLARSSADWHRLLEIAALMRTLIADEHTVYDPREPNDRLVLGMKGTMAEFELEWLRHRMLDGLWHRARKGEHPMRPPVGYIQDDENGRLQLDPDEEVRRAVALLFERYRLAGLAARASQRATLRRFRRSDRHRSPESRMGCCPGFITRRQSPAHGSPLSPYSSLSSLISSRAGAEARSASRSVADSGAALPGLS